MSAFSDRLRERRSELRLTQAAAAGRIGVSTSTLAKWERGEAVPSTARFEVIATLLGVKATVIGDWVREATAPSALDVAVDRIAALETRCAALEACLATLEASCSEPVTELSDAFGNSVTLDGSGITIDAAVVRLGGGLIQCTAGLATFGGVVRADALVANSVVASQYTPGAGNVW